MNTPFFGAVTEEVSLSNLLESENQIITLFRKDSSKFCMFCNIKLASALNTQQHFRGCVLSIIRRLINQEQQKLKNS